MPCGNKKKKEKKKMKEFIRIVQTDGVDEATEMHEDKTDVKGQANLSPSVGTIKNNLKALMVAKNYKYQRHYCDHDESDRRGCRLEDI